MKQEEDGRKYPGEFGPLIQQRCSIPGFLDYLDRLRLMKTQDVHEKRIALSRMNHVQTKLLLSRKSDAMFLVQFNF